MMPATPIAENHIKVSRSLFDEGMRAVENPAYKKSVKKTAAVLALLFGAAAAWLLYTGGPLLLLLGEAVFLGALLFWLSIMLPAKRRGSKYKLMTHGANGIPKRTTFFYQEHMSVVSNSGTETSIYYKDVLNWLETRNLYILNCSNNVSVLLDKNGFVKGDFHAVKALL